MPKEICPMTNKACNGSGRCGQQKWDALSVGARKRICKRLGLRVSVVFFQTEWANLGNSSKRVLCNDY